MATFGPENWDQFLDSIEAWWLDCTEFVNCGGRHKVGKSFHHWGTGIAIWCYKRTKVNPSKLTDLTLFIETQQDHDHPRFDFPPISFERTARQLERCVIDVAYLRDLAMRRLGPAEVEVRNQRDARDEWMYNECKARKSDEAILLDLNELHAGWPQITTPQGIGQAIDRHCRRKNLPLLRSKQTETN